MFCNLSGEGFANTPCLISLGPLALGLSHVGRYVAGAYHSVAFSIFGNGEIQGLSKGKVRRGVGRPKSSRWGLWSRHHFSHQHLFSLLPLRNHSLPSSYFTWFGDDWPDQGWVCVQVQPIRATHSPSHREWIRNAHRIQSESMSISWDSCGERQECLHLGRSKTRQQPSYHVGRCGPTKANTEGSGAKSGKRQFCVPGSGHTWRLEPCGDVSQWISYFV